MASAAASRPPAPPPPPPSSVMQQWLSPRVSFSLDDAGGGEAAGGAAGGKGNADFEFFLAGSTMLPADELFSGGRLVPLRVPASAAAVGSTSASSTRTPLVPKTPREEEAQAKDAVEHAAAPEEEERKAVVPARRWRDLLRMRKQQASSSSSSGTADTKPLRRLLRRGHKPPEQEPSLSLPLLREPEKPDKPSSAAPAPSPTQQQQNHHQLPPKIRLTAAQQLAPPPPADSPRLNAAGKVVFNGLGRSSSSPSSMAGGMERSHVRVTPVLNVPVCRKSVSVFGIDRLFSPSTAAAKKGRVAKKEAAAAPASSQ